MSLAERLAQLDSELDALSDDPASLEDVCARLLSGRSSDLAVVDAELESLAADVAGLDAVLDAARQQAASRAQEVASVAAERAERAKATRAEVEARVAALTAEQDAARAARAERAEREAEERAHAQAQAEERRAAAAAEAVAEQAAQAGAARDSAAAEQSPADTLGQLLADELDDLAAAPGADTRPEASAPDDTDIFGTDLFGDLGADAFDAPQEQLADVVTSEGVGMPASTLGDLASLLEQDDATVTETGAEPPSEADDLMAALFDATTETPLPEEEEPPARPKTVPPPLPSDSVRPPALEAAVLEGARESFEDLSDELDLLEVDDYEIVIDETSMDDSNTTGTELDGPALTAAELEPGPSAALEQAPDATDTGEQGEEEPEEKKGFFKKLFG